MDDGTVIEDVAPVRKLTRDLVKAAATLTDREARYLVDAYYSMQENRIRSAHQARTAGQAGEPHEVLGWYEDQAAAFEGQVKRALAGYVLSHPMGAWPMSVRGIGPVLCAGLLAHLSVNPWRCERHAAGAAAKPCRESAPCKDGGCGRRRIETAGAFWSFAGLVPGVEWAKGEKRPWNAQLKTLAWKIGESFVKVSGDDRAYYGKVYAERKAFEQAANEAGEYAEQAAAVLARKKIGKDTDAYAAYSRGRLPPAHVHARAKRYAVKMFLAHLHGWMYRETFGVEPPLPYPIAILGHAHMRERPGQ